MTRPNILLIIWDACRLDAASEYAPNLTALAEDNLWFENAITPGGYSFPAHASLVTGEYPHEHGMFSRTDEFRSMPLLETLGEQGYTRYGVSANGFASPRYGFDDPFDEFYNTQGQMVYPNGLDVHAYARRMEAETETFSPADISYTDLLRATVSHQHPVRSLANVTAAGLSELVNRYPLLQKVPHPRFNQYHEFAYSPRRNTDVLTSLFDREADADAPFFIFTNYMDAHHPYVPPKRLQREFCGRTFSYYELAEFADVTHPWDYMQRVERGDTLSQAELETVRNLYAGEVRRADEQLGRLLDALDRTGLAEETLIVVTADHGENLGETDAMGETRMGHECSASDHLLRVPLVIAHPDLDGRRVDDYVSIKDLCELCTGGYESLLASGGSDVSSVTPAAGIVSSQVPPPANSALVEKYPDLIETLRRRISVSYCDSWKVVMTSTEQSYASNAGSACEIAEAPDALVDTCRRNLSALETVSETDTQLSDDEVSQLEALGYM